MATGKEWFYTSDGQRKGPIPEAQIIEMIKISQISSGTLVWTKDFSEWQKIENTELGIHLQNMPPPRLDGEKFCSACGKLIGIRAEICPLCGVRVLTTVASKKVDAVNNTNCKFCETCGRSINTKAEICPYCGVRATVMGKSTFNKSRLTAGLFAVLLGDFGAHKFYLGETGLGVLYLCFFWTWIPGLIGVIEGILILCMTDEQFELKYNH